MTADAAHLLTDWQNLLPEPDIGADLLRRWQEPHRHYHDLRHLREGLSALAGLGCDDPAARLAIWFHDAVCDLDPDDERRSADLAGTVLTGAGCPPDLVAEVTRLVLITAHHRPEPADEIGCAVSDADLWVLAAPQARYTESVADLRREYAHLDAGQWRELRRTRITARLEAPIYRTTTARAALEGPARANLEHELADICHPRG